MNTAAIVFAALKEKSPSLFRALTDSGKLDEFVSERAEEIASEIVTRQMEIAAANGANKTDDPMEKVGILNMAGALAREAVFAEMLEFPEDDDPDADLMERLRMYPGWYWDACVSNRPLLPTPEKNGYFSGYDDAYSSEALLLALEAGSTVSIYSGPFNTKDDAHYALDIRWEVPE